MADTSRVPEEFPFFDDIEEDAGKNGKPPKADHIQKLIDATNALNYRGRPLFNWWGSSANDDASRVLRQCWAHLHQGGTKPRGRALILKPSQVRDATQAVQVNISGANHDYFKEYDLEGVSPALVDPDGLEDFPFGADLDHSTFALQDLGIGANATTTPAAAPGLISGMMYESAQHLVDPVSTECFTPPELAIPGGDIVATAPTGDLKKVGRLLDNFMHLVKYHRPQIGWSAKVPGTNYIDFTVDPDNFRFIFDQEVGEGADSAPGANKPAITLPLKNAAAGLRSQIRVGVYVYAAMSSAADDGEIGVANKDGSGGFEPTVNLLTNPMVISGTTFKWYSGTGAGQAFPADLTGDPSYFLGDATAGYDRICLCGRRKSGGAGTATLRVAAFTFRVFHFTS